MAGRWWLHLALNQRVGQCTILLAVGRTYQNPRKCRLPSRTSSCFQKLLMCPDSWGPQKNKNLGLFIDQQRKDIHCIEFILVCKLY